jgi:hypothetical protein
MDEARFAKLEVMMSDVHKAVMGNGQPGLVQKFQAHEVAHAKIEGGVNLVKWIIGIIGLPTLGSVGWLLFEKFKG